MHRAVVLLAFTCAAADDTPTRAAAILPVGSPSLARGCDTTKGEVWCGDRCTAASELSCFPSVEALAAPGFMWGAGTSAYQIEGAVDEGGRGATIWDTFAHTTGKIAGNATGDVADDHYHRWADDVQLAASLNLTHYRLSIAWSRILPDGTGRKNAAGIGFYRQLLTALHAAGVTPIVTLFHWDLPQALEDRGGWLSASTADAFFECV